MGLSDYSIILRFPYALSRVGLGATKKLYYYMVDLTTISIMCILT